MASFPQCSVRMDVGAELREARLRAGLSREDLSQRTKIQLAKLEALEVNAFERLPEGIYLDGLIRAYANEVGLDGSEMVARLQRHNAMPVEDEIDLADHERLDHEIDSAEYTDYIVPPPPTPASRSPGPTPEMFEAADVTYAAPRVDVAADPPRRGGVGRFVLPLLALLAALGLGAYLYDRGRTFSLREEIGAPVISHEDTTATAVGDERTSATDAASANSTSDGAALDAIPADRPASTAHHAPDALEPPATAPTASAPASEPLAVRSDRPSAPGTRSETGAPGATRPTDTPGTTGGSLASGTSETSTAPVGTGTPEIPRASGAPDAPDLSGSWALATHVESSTLRSFEGLQLAYRIELQQSGDRIAGQGVKILENGRALGNSARTPIAVQGTLAGNRLTLTFTERGARRESAGKMILDVHEDGVLRGRFSSSAAGSSGTVEARRP